jgi:Cu-Zn family superoxide dismutase
LGNLITDENGNAKYIMENDVIKLYGDANIIDRALIIHRDTDDCGRGIGDKQKTSLITGNAGDRIACAVIGYLKYNFIKK